MLSVSEYAKKFDMAVLAQDTTESVIRTGCERARDYRVAAYYTTPTWTPLVAEILHGSDVHVGVVLAFPYGTQTTRTKEAEIHEALEVGGTEIRTATRMGVDHGVDHVKTATGSAVLPDVRHLEVMTSALGGRTRLKLSGVPRTFALAATLWMLDMGVDLIGTRSAPDLVDQYRAHVETSRAAEKIPARV
jgi:deoxyribose-phosphate aldolase